MNILRLPLRPLILQRLRLGLILLGLNCLLISPLYADATTLHQIIDEYWLDQQREDPFSATRNGYRQFNGKVPQVTPADQQRRLRKATQLRQRLADVDQSDLSDSDALNAQLLDFILKHKIALGAFEPWRIPVLSDSGFHVTPGFVVGNTPFQTERDFRNYLDRLRALPDYLDQNVANMRQGLKDGFTQPQQILPNMLPAFAAQLNDNPEAHRLYTPFKSMPDSIADSTQAELRKAASAVLANAVLPAYQRAHDFMRDEYSANATKNIGALHLPQGEDYYAALVRFYTTLDDATPEAIHTLGRSEVARIKAAMQQILTEVSFQGDVPAFIEYLRREPEFYPQTAMELLQRAAWLSKDIDGKLPSLFGRLPRQPYSVEPVPADIAPNYTAGRYVGAPLHAPRGGQYWVNTYALHTRPLYQLPALTLHEAMPGHHLQIALASEMTNVPAFRRQYYPHAFGEGWGLYAEKLGVELGVYRTPYEHFGRLSYEMWRACRLVIDTGIHAFGWSRQQAMDYLSEHTALSLHEVRTEIDRYISWPGQALAYKMGELTIVELRAEAAAALGSEFDVREFHDAVLAEGGLPLDLLRERIATFISERLAQRQNGAPTLKGQDSSATVQDTPAAVR